MKCRICNNRTATKIHGLCDHCYKIASKVSDDFKSYPTVNMKLTKEEIKTLVSALGVMFNEGDGELLKKLMKALDD